VNTTPKSGSGAGQSWNAGQAGSAAGDADYENSIGRWLTHGDYPGSSLLQSDRSLRTARNVSLGLGLAAGAVALGGLAAGGAAVKGGGLVHLTNAGNAIVESGAIIGRAGIYATSLKTATSTGVNLMLRTGVSGATSGFQIPSAALGAFTRPVPIGVVTAWRRAFGTQYAAAGTINLATGAFVRVGVNWNQVMLYAVDATATAGASIGVYFGLQD
jgi:hypothetical protein